MTGCDFSEQFLCDFTPDERWSRLIDRLCQYYRDTPSEMNNRDAYVHWRRFKEWSEGCGYTQDEINRAKKSISTEIMDS